MFKAAVLASHFLNSNSNIAQSLWCVFFFFFFNCGTSGKEPACQCRKYKRQKRCGFHPCIAKILWRRVRQPTPVLLPRESHGQRSLVGHSPCGCKKLDTTERLILQLDFRVLSSPFFNIKQKMWFKHVVLMWF